MIVEVLLFIVHGVGWLLCESNAFLADQIT